jgi:hypothetical protein
MNKVCPNCGLPLHNGATPCDQCGTFLEGAVLLKTRTNSGRARIPVLAFLTLAALIAAILYFSTSHRSRQSAISGNPVASSHFRSFVNHASQRGKVTYEVVYQPETVVFDEAATERAFIGISDDAATFTLDGAEPAVRQLKPGSVLFLYGVALRRVTAVESHGSEIIVSTTQADLTDAIRDGKIEWQVPVDFEVGAIMARPQPKSAWSSFSDVFIASVLAAEPGLTLEGSLLNFDFEIGFVPEGENRLKLEINLKNNDVGGVTVELKGAGYVEHLNTIGKVLIHSDLGRSKLDDLEFSADQFNGKVDFTWIAQQKSNQIKVFHETKIRIPGAVWEYPLVIGGLPFILEISAAVMVHPALTSKDSFTTGRFTLTYNAKEGFKSTNGGTASEGDVHGSESIEHDTSIFGLGPSAFLAALELPRVELALGVMSPLNMFLTSTAPNWVGALNPETPYLRITKLSKMIENAAFPIKPFAYANIVTSASTVTSGTTGTMAGGAMLTAPCEKAQLDIGGNVGVGAKIGFDIHHLATENLGKTLGSLLPHEATFEPFEASMQIFKKEQIAYKNGVKCLGDK